MTTLDGMSNVYWDDNRGWVDALTNEDTRPPTRVIWDEHRGWIDLVTLDQIPRAT